MPAAKQKEIFAESRFLTVEEAAQVMGLQYSQTRALLGDPDSQRVTEAGHIQFLFSEEKVLDRKLKREEYIKKKLEDLGKKACYFCQHRYPIKDLTSGICPGCQARKIVKNFITHGKVFSHAYDKSRLDLLKEAISEIEKQTDYIG